MTVIGGASTAEAMAFLEALADTSVLLLSPEALAMQLMFLREAAGRSPKATEDALWAPEMATTVGVRTASWWAREMA